MYRWLEVLEPEHRGLLQIVDVDSRAGPRARRSVKGNALWLILWKLRGKGILMRENVVRIDYFRASEGRVVEA